jgi:hypothetical protein
MMPPSRLVFYAKFFKTTNSASVVSSALAALLASTTLRVRTVSS